MHHTMKLHPGPFSQMSSGTKKSELRLNDEKRRHLKVGDTITFTNRENERESVTATITYLRTYPTFQDMFRAVKDDYPDWEEAPFVKSMHQYYSPDEAARWGTLEIGVQVGNRRQTNRVHFSSILRDNRTYPVTFIEPTHVKEGVACDIYRVDGDDSWDVGVVSIEPGFRSPRQRILKGITTIQRFVSGQAYLYVTDSNDTEHTHFLSRKRQSRTTRLRCT